MMTRNGSKAQYVPTVMAVVLFYNNQSRSQGRVSECLILSLNFFQTMLKTISMLFKYYCIHVLKRLLFSEKNRCVQNR